ncbi:MAG: membrane protein of unknown function [Candidatus Nitrospira kreftii]|uniref:Glutaredoxin domain-containing protein n=1 Tax=Candidatus Nitrospira kreftii TaxID=2652173 RepID=A0A7S8FAY3_9BACT|nr:MAG: membrane protein of unknown function [Candidatus Nitrospira kreftii]
MGVAHHAFQRGPVRHRSCGTLTDQRTLDVPSHLRRLAGFDVVRKRDVVFRPHRQSRWEFVRAIGTGLVLLTLILGSGAPTAADEPFPDLEVFVHAGCPHCEAAKVFLDELRRERPGLQIFVYDIADHSAARQRLAALFSDRGMTSIGVPTFLIGTELIVGFLSSDTTGAEIRARLDQRTQAGEAPLAAERIKTAWFGELRVRDLGLPLFTVTIGLLDGFNPCAMWVLLFLMSLLVNLQDRRKMAFIAGTFVLFSGLIYFAFMAAWPCSWGRSMSKSSLLFTAGSH